MTIMDKMTVFIKMPDIVIMEMPGGTGVKHQNKLHTLNFTAFEIFDLCDGNRTIQDIETVISDRYTDKILINSIEEFLEQLHSLGLVREKNGHDFVHILRKH